ncbi:LtrC-like protein [Streptococcus agalactiae]|uniref:PBECR4 domain-containing protein n=1 Tax=Streptococcus TaxID=1301 RepID=UPI0006202EFF|nr:MULTISPECIES: PBECR4 domain-containing protein [Streptococcus]KKF48734.1 hypothetical protein AF59_04395 [Streptococcus uberis C5072]KKF60636.1 hypothetical protein AF69_09775 [Streptococcus uberis 6736]KKF62437.1 hypothetical protein AF58_04325 [Streptococcus uberis C6344]TQB90284.1 LtrC-like protein [Streptococcus agalactiae]TQB94569.1 LtrC-like protein [Streptococcus agalactiae]
MAQEKPWRDLSILDVAQSLGMSLDRVGSRYYSWEDHDSFMINTQSNSFKWYSRDKFGDVLNLVQVVREEQTGKKVSFKEAKHYLEKGEFEPFNYVEPTFEPFDYYLKPYETDTRDAESYLMKERSLSKETIDFFKSKNVLSQATLKTGDYFEPVIVFKSLGYNNELLGASLQGIRENKELYDRGRLKRIMKRSDGMSGLSIDIGKPNRLIFAEAPIDLMSYYELHKDKLQDVRLVAMDGLKEATISRYFMELQAEITNSSYEVNWKETPSALEKVAQVTDFFKNGKNNSVITLAVDNDKAGKDFVNKLHNKGINCETDFPPLISGKVKSDWNDILKQEKINKKKYEEIQDLIDTVESLSQTAYFWVSEEDLNQPSEVVSILDDWFSSDKVETAYNSEFFELIVGDYTYMIEFKNKELSLQNIEEYSKYISNRINEIGFESTIKELEMIITDFNQVKLAISSEMDKQMDLIRNRLSKEKSPEESQGHRKMDRSKISSGFLQENLEGSTLPVSNDTFEQTVTSHPTVSYPLLHFSTDNITVSNTRAGYHVATETDLRNLNYYAPALQSTATWYRDILSNSKVTYLLKGEDEHPKEVIVDFSKDKFAHLTGIRPIGSGLNAEKVLDDLVEGRGHYPNISVSHGFIDKVQVLPLLQEITMSKSFVFDHLEEIAKMRSLKASHVIQSENKNLIVALKTVDDVTFPASLLKSKGTINNQLIENAKENEILGVVRQRNNRTEIISINDKYITDGGQELLEIVKQRGKDLSPKKDPKQDIVIDSDADGLSDEVEYGLGTDPFSEGILDDKPQLVNSETIKEMIADNKTKDLSMTLKEGIKNFLDSEQYKQFLKTMSQFHHYSPRNIQLLLAQNPTVTAVASFKKWKDDFGRTVNKGEKSLRVWAPVTVNKKDPKTGEIVLDKEGKPVKQTYFKLVPVFDVSQTSGKELPKLINELEGSHEDYANLYRASKEVSLEKGVTIEINNSPGEAKGYYSPNENKIVLKPGMSEQQTLKTLFHEMAHSDLHNNEAMKGKQLTRSTEELQAESVAYVVASHYGFDTGEYTFGYLASWSQDKEGLADLEAQLSIVQKEANDLIKRLDTTLEKYKDVKLQKGKFSEKLNHYREKAQEEIANKGGTLDPKEQARSKQNQEKMK